MPGKIFDFNGATRYTFGCGSVGRLGVEAAKFGKKALLVLEPALEQLGVGERIKEALSSDGVEVVLFKEFQQEPEPTEADAAAALAKSEGCDLVVGVGGGSGMDLAKAAAVLAKNDGKAVEYTGVDLVPNPRPAPPSWFPPRPAPAAK